MKYQASEPDAIEVNVSDVSGHTTLIKGLLMLGLLILLILSLAQIFQFFSDKMISRKWERTKIAPAFNYLFNKKEPSKALEDFAKKLTGVQYPISVYILKDDSLLNAFCGPGDNIFISTGLLKSVQTENEFAFVLAHELGHSYHRHFIKGNSFRIILNIFLSTIGLSDIGFNFTAKKNSRSLEQASDDFAIKSLKKYYGHTFAAEDFFERLEQKQGSHGEWTEKWLSKSGQYFSTHPLTKDRIKKIKETQDLDATFHTVSVKKSIVLSKVLKEI